MSKKRKFREVKEGLAGLTPPQAIRDTRLRERAIKERWPIREDIRPAIMDRMSQIAIDPKSSEREATSATKAILYADKMNQEEELNAQGTTIHMKHSGGVATADVTQILSDPDYLEWKREQALRQDTDAGAVCQDGIAGNGKAVENGTPSSDSGQGSNGHGNGQV